MATNQCVKCNRTNAAEMPYCPWCGTKQPGAVSALYQDPYGAWEVTTESDCEGRTTKHLGTHTGYIDEIALYLAQAASYKLTFKKVWPAALTSGPRPKPEPRKVDITLDIESGTWDMNAEKRAQFVANMLQGRKVARVAAGQYHAAVTLIFTGENNGK